MGIRTDEHIVLDDGLEFVDPIVVAGDGTGTDIYPGSDLGITQIGQMTALGTNPKAGLLHLDEVANVRILLQNRPRTQAGKRTH